MRGHLFENMIISEALKQMYHAGSSDAFYFFRDHKGNEVDLALPGGAGFHAMEIKSAQTVSPDFFGCELLVPPPHHPTTPPPHHPIPFSDNPSIIFENSSGMSWKIHRYSTLVKFVIMRKHGYYPTMITAERLIL